MIGFFIINYPFWGTPIFGNTRMTVEYGSVEYLELLVCLHQHGARYLCRSGGTRMVNTAVVHEKYATVCDNM